MNLAAMLAAIHTPTYFNFTRENLQPKQQTFYDRLLDTPVTFYGGAKGGGKSFGLRNIFLMRRQLFPGTNGAIFRKTFPELEGNHIRPLFKQFPELSKYYNSTKRILTLPNTSTLEFCYCENDKDLERYDGREFDDLGIEEAGQWTEAQLKRIRGSNRSSRKGVKPRTAFTGNPGGIGHQYLKRVFVERRFKPDERPEDFAFIQALVDDNPALMENDPDYVRRLDSITNEALRKAYRWGSWDIFAGQFFGEISREIHLVKPFDIPAHWNRFGAYDYGFNHPGSFGWFAVDEDGNVYLYRHYKKSQQRVDQFAHHLNKFPDTKSLYPIVAGHDCWAKRTHTINQQQGPNPPTIAEEFAAHEIFLKQATIDRIQGAAQLRSHLAWQNLPSGRVKPKFFIFENCVDAFDTLARMIHDPDRIEDVLKVDATEGDDNTGDDDYDMIRYGLMSRPMITEPLVAKVAVGSPAWHAKQNENLFDQAMEFFKEQEEKKNGGWSGS